DGDILVLSDQDDVWLAPRLEACEQALTRDPEAAAVFSDAHLVDRSLRPMGALLSEAVGFTPRQQHRARSRGMFDILVKRNVVTGATLAFRSTFRNLLLPFTDEIEHDAWIGLLLSAVARIVFVPQPLLLYRQHGGNQIGARPLSLVARLRRARSDRVAGLKRQRARNAQAIVRIEAAGAA